MCGRFALAADKKIIEMLYDLEIRGDLAPRYNIAPSQKIPTLRLAPDSGQKELVSLKWGLIPFWADRENIGSGLINARAETAPDKPSFRNAFKKRRLLIPATGFFEWKVEGGGKQPYYVCRKDGRPFSMAGLWECWEKGESPLETCTILTTEPNSLVKSLHKRMPVIIPREVYDKWLDPATDKAALLKMLRPFPAKELIAYPVSRKVNNPAQDIPELVEPC